MVAINVPDPSVPYLILLLNCLIFRSARQFALGVTTDVMRPFVTEFIATLELCADCAELGKFSRTILDDDECLTT